MELVEKFPRSYFNTLANNRRFEYLRKWIDDQTPALADPFYTLSTKCFWILNGLTDFPRCVICGKEISANRRLNVSVTGHSHVYVQCCCI